MQGASGMWYLKQMGAYAALLVAAWLGVGLTEARVEGGGSSTWQNVRSISLAFPAILILFGLLTLLILVLVAHLRLPSSDPAIRLAIFTTLLLLPAVPILFVPSPMLWAVQFLVQV